MSFKHDFIYSEESGRLYVGDHVDMGESTPEAFPIYQTSSYTFPSLDTSLEARKVGGYVYGRTNHPNYTSLAEMMAYLENGQEAWVTSSGMFSIFIGIIASVKAGDHILSSENIYGETHEVLKNILPHYGIESTFVDFNDRKSVENAIRPNTKLFYGEVIANPLTTLIDVDMISDIAHKAGGKLLIDNTFSSPYVITPLTHGADIVINSITKYINGHFDVIGGAIVSNHDIITRVKFLTKILGGCLAPFSCWLALRGARTFDLRLEKQNRNAIKVAAALEANPKVSRVYHPSLESHPQHALARRLFKENACGAMMSFNLEDNAGKTDLFIKSLQMIQFVSTLGGYRTIVSHPFSSSHKELSPEEKAKSGIHNGTIRLSVGIENPDDIIKDLFGAIDASADV